MTFPLIYAIFQGEVMKLLYQNLLIGPLPYRIGVFQEGIEFRNHRHPDLEFNFCISGGGYELSVGGRSYEMRAGSLAIVGSMVDHQYFRRDASNALHVSITVGSVFLGEYYEPFAKAAFERPVFDLSAEEFRKLREAFESIAKTKYEDSHVSRLAERGNLYQICALILEHFILPRSDTDGNAALLSVNRIEPAMECIRNNYREPLGVSSVAALCGYSDSNFCKHFKRITGVSFHTALNKKRVETACYWLKNSELPLENIAAETGFADAKSLCRVFKKEMGMTPTEYRNAG